MGWKTSFGDADEIEMEAESVTTPGREARLSQEQSLAAQAAAKVAAGKATQSSSLFSMRNLLIAGAIAGGAYYLYKRRGE